MEAYIISETMTISERMTISEGMTILGDSIREGAPIFAFSYKGKMGQVPDGACQNSASLLSLSAFVLR